MKGNEEYNRIMREYTMLVQLVQMRYIYTKKRLSTSLFTNKGRCKANIKQNKTPYQNRKKEKQ